ncbi:MAG: sigma 54-interacting transcriptional regulator [Acidobacteriota bacterium]|nr:sigma 54-interacting transcriptional regulator [Acidobacteriota bacterium]
MSTKGLALRYRAAEWLAEGRNALENNRFEEAVGYLESALRAGLRPAEEEASARCMLSEALERMGQHREQLEAVAKYADSSERSRLTEPTRLRVLLRLAWAYSFNNDAPRAIGLFTQALRAARRLNAEDQIGACHLGLGRTYLSVSEFRLARDHYAAALERYRRVGDWRMLAKVHLSVSNVAAREGRHRDAIRSIEQAIALVGDRGEHDLLCRAYNDLSIIYENLGDTPRVLAAFEKCIAHVRQTNNLLALGIYYNNLAMRLIRVGEWGQAERLAGAAADLVRDTPRAEYAASVLQTRALLHLLKGRLEEADALLAEALAWLSREAEREHRVASEIEMTVGRVRLAGGDADAAVDSLERAVELASAVGDQWYLAEARLWLAEALLRRGDAEESRRAVEAARAELKQGTNLPLWGILMRLTAKLSAAEGRLALAFQSLGQSTSAFEVLGYSFDCAVNRVVRARLLERSGRVEEAVAEAASAHAVFERLGAAAEGREADEYLASVGSRLASRGAGESDGPPARAGHAPLPGEGLVSVMDGFIAWRLVQASVSRRLLLQELAAIAREQSAAEAAFVVEVAADGQLTAVAASGAADQVSDEALRHLAGLSADEYERHFVFRFAHLPRLSYLLYLLRPRAGRFRRGEVNLRPLLDLAEQGLHVLLLRSEACRPQAFDPTRVSERIPGTGFISASRAMTRVLEQLDKIRSSDATVLVTGESGTGKELVAHALHAESGRREGIFLPFNCSAVPREIIEGHLFGYRRGSFTGAATNHGGVIRAAEGGTLFLDEVGELPLELQPKLLRFLQEGEIHPLGETKPVRVDVRVIAATNADLERETAAGRFREDLFYRLNVIRVNVPPLRERREEIPALISYYLDLYRLESGKSGIQLAAEAVDLLTAYDWPGNVRQLCNELRRVVAYADSNTVVTAESLSSEIVRGARDLGGAKAAATLANPFSVVVPFNRTLAEATEELERQMIQSALRRSSGNIARAAKALGLSRAGLYLKLNRLNQKPEDR